MRTFISFYLIEEYSISTYVPWIYKKIVVCLQFDSRFTWKEMTLNLHVPRHCLKTSFNFIALSLSVCFHWQAKYFTQTFKRLTSQHNRIYCQLSDRVLVFQVHIIWLFTEILRVVSVPTSCSIFNFIQSCLKATRNSIRLRCRRAGIHIQY